MPTIKCASRVALVVAILTCYVGFVGLNMLFIENQRMVAHASFGVPEIAPPARPIPTSLRTRGNKFSTFPHPTFNPLVKDAESVRAPDTTGKKFDPNRLDNPVSKPPYNFIISVGLATSVTLFVLVYLVSVWFKMPLDRGLCHGIAKLASDVCAACCNMQQTRTTTGFAGMKSTQERCDNDDDVDDQDNSSKRASVLKRCLSGRVLWVALLATVSLMVGVVVTSAVGSHFDAVCIYNPTQYEHVCDLTALFLSEFRKDFAPIAAAANSTTLIWVINSMAIARARNQSYSNFIVYNDHDADLCYDHNLVPLASIEKFLTRFGHFYELFDHGNHGVNPVGKFRIFPRSFDTLVGHSGPLSIDVDPCGDDRPPTVNELPTCNGYVMPFRSDFEAKLDSEIGKDRWRTPEDVNHYALCAIAPWL